MNRLLPLILAVILIFLQTQAVWSKPVPVKIGVLAKRGYDRCLEKWAPTANYLSDALPDYKFEIVPLSFDEITPAVANNSIDFILANSSIYIGLEVDFGVTRIATLKNRRLHGTYTTFGGVIFTLKKNQTLRKLIDLKQKSFMAVDETSFGGWRMAWRELQEHGIAPHTDFTELRFSGTHDAVVFAVLNGEVDAGTVRTDTLERMSLSGLINLEDFHVFHEHGGGKVHLPFLHSTREYPEWPIAKLPSTDESMAERVAIELIKMPKDSNSALAAMSSGWTIPLNYQSVHDCLKALNLPPYTKAPPTIKEILAKIWPILIVLSLAVCALAAWLYQYRRLNNRLTSTNKELNTAYKDLKFAQSQMIQAEKLQAVGRLSAGIAHEINTPMQYVNDNTRFVKETVDDLRNLFHLVDKLLATSPESEDFSGLSAQINDYATEIDLDFLKDELPIALDQTLSGVDRVVEIVKAMKEFSRPGEDEKIATDINQLLQNTVTISSNEWKYAASMQMNLTKPLPLVTCYGAKLGQVFLNMIINAAHAIAEKQIDTPEHQGIIDISTEIKENYFTVTIKDNGTGMTEETLANMYDPFYTTKEVGKGTGQGLSIAYTTVVDTHRGKIECNSLLGKGSEFRVFLPLQ